MSERKFEITDARGGAAFPVRVTTRATESEVVGVDDGILRVRLVASPAGSEEANKELIAMLARFLEVEPGKIEIVAGDEVREKLVSIEDVSVADIEAKLKEA